jgi:hypothetical protein
MLSSVTGILFLAATIMVIAHAGWGRPNLWVPVLLMAIAHLLSYIPLR